MMQLQPLGVPIGLEKQLPNIRERFEHLIDPRGSFVPVQPAGDGKLIIQHLGQIRCQDIIMIKGESFLPVSVTIRGRRGSIGNAVILVTRVILGVAIERIVGEETVLKIDPACRRNPNGIADGLYLEYWHRRVYLACHRKRWWGS